MKLLSKESLMQILGSSSSGKIECSQVDYIKLQYSSYMIGYQQGYRKYSVSKLIDPAYEDIINGFLKLINDSSNKLQKTVGDNSINIIKKEHLLDVLHTDSDGKLNASIEDYLKFQYLCYKLGYTDGFKKFQNTGTIEPGEKDVLEDFLKAINKGNENKDNKLKIIN